MHICQSALNVSNEGNVFCSRKQKEVLMGFKRTPD